MTIPSQKLPDILEPGVYSLRSADFSKLLNPQLEYTEAVAMAYRGEIEGVATKAGRVKYLRILDECERARATAVESEIIEAGGSTAFARTNLGAYRQAVRSSIPGAHSLVAGEVIGHIWQLHGARV